MSGCVAQQQPELRSLVTRPAKVSFGSVSEERHAVIGSMMLCLSSAGRVEVSSVEPVNANGPLVVVDYGLRLNPLPSGGRLIGGDYGSLSSLGVRPDRIVDVVCSDVDAFELVVELETSQGLNASADGWLVNYATSVGTGQTRVQLGVLLCGSGPIDGLSCRG